jgi:hypothetical protein
VRMAMWVAAPIPPDNQVQPGWLGFFVVLALGIVTYLLWRNMNTHLKRVNFERRPVEGPGDQQTSGDATSEDGPADGGEVLGGSGGPEADDTVNDGADYGAGDGSDEAGNERPV